jgi:hypothetical protein
MYVCMYVWINANDGIIFSSDKHFWWMDGYAVFRQGELVSGRLGKTIVYIHTYILDFEYVYYVFVYANLFVCM